MRHFDDITVSINAGIVSTVANITSGTTDSSIYIHEISNGFCRFSPTTNKGRWIFMLQTFFLSVFPVLLLVLQNGLNFNAVVKSKTEITFKVCFFVGSTSPCLNYDFYIQHQGFVVQSYMRKLYNLFLSNRMN